MSEAHVPPCLFVKDVPIVAVVGHVDPGTVQVVGSDGSHISTCQIDLGHVVAEADGPIRPIGVQQLATLHSLLHHTMPHMVRHGVGPGLVQLFQHKPVRHSPDKVWVTPGCPHVGGCETQRTCVGIDPHWTCPGVHVVLHTIAVVEAAILSCFDDFHGQLKTLIFHLTILSVVG